MEFKEFQKIPMKMTINLKQNKDYHFVLICRKCNWYGEIDEVCHSCPNCCGSYYWYILRGTFNELVVYLNDLP